MSTQRRILASQANGRLSIGPVTVAGKQLASRNALQHGLLARCLVLEDESAEAFHDLLSQYVARFLPADPIELGFVEEMVGAAWRMRRAWAIETRMLDTGAPASPEVSPVDRIAAAFQSLAATPALPLMHRYETRLHMLFQRALHNLMLLRAVVKNEVQNEVPNEVPNEPSPVSEH